VVVSVLLLDSDSTSATSTLPTRLVFILTILEFTAFSGGPRREPFLGARRGRSPVSAEARSGRLRASTGRPDAKPPARVEG